MNSLFTVNEKDRIEKIKKCIYRMLEISNDTHMYKYIQNDTEQSLIRHARGLYKSTEFSKGFNEDHERIKIYNIIFLKKYDVQI